jgi:hypothetical protein
VKGLGDPAHAISQEYSQFIQDKAAVNDTTHTVSTWYGNGANIDPLFEYLFRDVLNVRYADEISFGYHNLVIKKQPVKWTTTRWTADFVFKKPEWMRSALNPKDPVASLKTMMAIPETLIVLRCSVEYGPNFHATLLVIDTKTRKMLYIDPHGDKHNFELHFQVHALRNMFLREEIDVASYGGATLELKAKMDAESRRARKQRGGRAESKEERNLRKDGERMRLGYWDLKYSRYLFQLPEYGGSCAILCVMIAATLGKNYPMRIRMYRVQPSKSPERALRRLHAVHSDAGYHLPLSFLHYVRHIILKLGFSLRSVKEMGDAGNLIDVMPPPPA